MADARARAHALGLRCRTNSTVAQRPRTHACLHTAVRPDMCLAMATCTRARPPRAPASKGGWALGDPPRLPCNSVANTCGVPKHLPCSCTTLRCTTLWQWVRHQQCNAPGPASPPRMVFKEGRRAQARNGNNRRGRLGKRGGGSEAVSCGTGRGAGVGSVAQARPRRTPPYGWARHQRLPGAATATTMELCKAEIQVLRPRSLGAPAKQSRECVCHLRPLIV